MCRDNDTLVFIEVKTRTREDFGRPFAAVDREKQKRISRGALAWLRMLENPDILFRFDVVEVIVADGTAVDRSRFETERAHKTDIARSARLTFWRCTAIVCAGLADRSRCHAHCRLKSRFAFFVEHATCRVPRRTGRYLIEGGHSLLSGRWHNPRCVVGTIYQFCVMAEPILVAQSKEPIFLLPKMANRHGLIAGATGTGKTVTLQTLAENFSARGVAVFMADVKGDLAGLSQAGANNPKVVERAKELKIDNFTGEACPVVFWDVFGEQGHPVRATVSEMGPLLLGRLLDLNDTQAGVLNMVFKIADDNGLLLLDLKDLRAMLQYVADNADQFKTQYGNVSAASAGAIQRNLLALESQGADKFFGEPALNLEDLIQTQNGRGVVNILASDKLMQKSPKVYATFLLWMLSELFENLPEIGDPEKPKLVFFFDEAHLLFTDIEPAVGQKIEQMVRLIRSKGVGVYFVSQNPLDIPEVVLGQLGNRVQHALRAFTPRDQKAVKAAAQTFRQNPKLKTETVLTELAVGEALVSMLDENGSPEVVERAKIVPPRSQVGAITPEQRKQIINSSVLAGHYEKAIDRESAYEKLQARAGEKTAKRRRSAGGTRRSGTCTATIVCACGGIGNCDCGVPAQHRAARRRPRFTCYFTGQECDARGEQPTRAANRARPAWRNPRRQRKTQMIVAAFVRTRNLRRCCRQPERRLQ